MKQHPFVQKLLERQKICQHYICLGLDPDPLKLPHHFTKDLNGCAKFLKEVIQATSHQVLCYKPNMAFFEAFGIEGIELLKQVRSWIPTNVPLILDAKRGDIGNTSKKIASYLFDYLGADATTLHPYMGEDSLKPFFEYEKKFNFVLTLTSNPSAKEFECSTLKNDIPLYLKVLKKAQIWQQTYQNIGVVIGATQKKEIEVCRKKAPKLLFLMPGVGTQGGNYHETIQKTLNQDKLVIINMTRSILYANQDKQYLDKMLLNIQKHSTPIIEKKIKKD